jgi:hypothetical protein
MSRSIQKSRTKRKYYSPYINIEPIYKKLIEYKNITNIKMSSTKTHLRIKFKNCELSIVYLQFPHLDKKKWIETMLLFNKNTKLNKTEIDKLLNCHSSNDVKEHKNVKELYNTIQNIQNC